MPVKKSNSPIPSYDAKAVEKANHGELSSILDIFEHLNNSIDENISQIEHKLYKLSGFSSNCDESTDTGEMPSVPRLTEINMKLKRLEYLTLRLINIDNHIETLL